jgi:phosphotransferase system enzyme I (PtsI)
VLKLISMAIATANKANVPIAVCGEMAGEPRLTRMLLGMGLRHFSMHPAHLLEIKRRVLSSDVAASRPLVNRMRRSDDPERVAALLDRLNE